MTAATRPATPTPRLTRCWTQAAVELDVEKRRAMYREAETMINADQPYVYLWVPQDIYGVSKQVTGWQPSADSRINLHDACVELTRDPGGGTGDEPWKAARADHPARFPVLLGVSLIVFVMMTLTPGDPVQIMVGEQSITPEQEAATAPRPWP